jgi:phage replication O-like protein O
MASPQVENGYTRIANELLEALVQIYISGNECRIYLAIIRRTYGHAKCQAAVSITLLMRDTGIDRKGVIRALSVLEARNMIHIDRSGYINVIGPQKDYEQWKTGGVDATTPTGGVDATKTSGVSATHKRKKKYLTVFDHWNSKGIIKHRALTAKMERAINGRLREKYTLEDITRAIDNYAAVFSDPNCFFSYRWTLTDFLNRGLDRFVDDARPLENFRRDKQGAKCLNAGAGYPRSRMTATALLACDCSECTEELKRREDS